MQGHDKKGTDIVTNLESALKWFQKSFEEDHLDDVRFRNFEVVDQVKGDFVMDYTKSHSMYINQGESITDEVVEREKARDTNRTDRHDIRRFTVCWVVAVRYVSPLSTMEKKHYYVVYRNKWYGKWANNLYPSAKKWFNRDGITLKADILFHCIRNPEADNRDVSKTSTLVLVMENLEMYYVNLDRVNRLATKNLGIVTDKWNQQVVGIPREEFSTEDVNDYS